MLYYTALNDCILYSIQPYRIILYLILLYGTSAGESALSRSCLLAITRRGTWLNLSYTKTQIGD